MQRRQGRQDEPLDPVQGDHLIMPLHIDSEMCHTAFGDLQQAIMCTLEWTLHNAMKTNTCVQQSKYGVMKPLQAGCSRITPGVMS